MDRQLDSYSNVNFYLPFFLQYAITQNIPYK